MDTIYKVIEDCEVKKLGERQYEFTASTSTEDRDGEVIDSTGWDLKNFKKNPVIMYAHDYRSLPIGKATRVWISGGKLKNTIQFPPEGTYEFADIVERLVDTGYLKTESVGFIPKKWADGDGGKAPRRTYTKQELLEISIVPVPSNPDALRNAVDEGVITTKEFQLIQYGNDKVGGENGAPWINDDSRVHAKLEETKELGEDLKPLDLNDIDDIIREHVNPISQEELKDELDYLKESIASVGLSEDAKPIARELAEEIRRLLGDDTPIEIEEDETEDTLSKEDIVSIIKDVVSTVIAKAQGKV